MIGSGLSFMRNLLLVVIHPAGMEPNCNQYNSLGYGNQPGTEPFRMKFDPHTPADILGGQESASVCGGRCREAANISFLEMVIGDAPCPFESGFDGPGCLWRSGIGCDPRSAEAITPPCFVGPACRPCSSPPSSGHVPAGPFPGWRAGSGSGGRSLERWRSGSPERWGSCRVRRCSWPRTALG